LPTRAQGDAIVVYGNSTSSSITSVGRLHLERRVVISPRPESPGNVKFTTLASDQRATGSPSACLVLATKSGSRVGRLRLGIRHHRHHHGRPPTLPRPWRFPSRAAPASCSPSGGINNKRRAVQHLERGRRLGTAAAGPDVGAVPNPLRLSADPNSDDIMLGAARRWPRRELRPLDTGSAWGVATERDHRFRVDDRPAAGLSSGKTTTARR